MSEENKNNDQGHNSDQPGKKKKTDEFPIQEYRLVPAHEGYADYEEDEIDLIELAKTIWDNRVIIYKFVAIGVVLGLVVALLSPKEYKSNATLMPETQSSNAGASGLLQQYGGLLGIGGGASLEGGGIIPPQLYPQMVQSMPFQLELLNTEVEFPRFETSATVYTFFDEVYAPVSVLSYVKQYTIGLPGKLIGLFKEEAAPRPLPKGFETDSVISVTKGQMQIIENMRGRVSVSLDDESGIINLSITMPDPEAAAQLAQKSIGLIREYVVNYKTQKAEEDLVYAREQLEGAKEEFEAVQNRLAEFRDSNVNLSSARAQTQLQRLQSEYDLAFNVYNSLAQQVEQAKLKVQEQTPVVSVLQPVQVPVNDETSGAMILIVFVMLSGIASIGWIFIRQFLESDPFGRKSED
ncbi:Wzz/FepE/Etk N-terminal domain-containing protein [Gracilimonas sp. Q87]|uniref:Wzz/FepE/Etk N-terminal domain-containing protein n=1 Tax=Gracilimonas sp. Q87 TaxID=3384766 RepID=UPI0039845D2B